MARVSARRARAGADPASRAAGAARRALKHQGRVVPGEARPGGDEHDHEATGERGGPPADQRRPWRARRRTGDVAPARQHRQDEGQRVEGPPRRAGDGDRWGIEADTPGNNPQGPPRRAGDGGTTWAEGTAAAGPWLGTPARSRRSTTSLRVTTAPLRWASSAWLPPSSCSSPACSRPTSSPRERPACRRRRPRHGPARSTVPCSRRASRCTWPVRAAERATTSGAGRWLAGHPGARHAFRQPGARGAGPTSPRHRRARPIYHPITGFHGLHVPGGLVLMVAVAGPRARERGADRPVGGGHGLPLALRRPCGSSCSPRSTCCDEATGGLRRRPWSPSPPSGWRCGSPPRLQSPPDHATTGTTERTATTAGRRAPDDLGRHRRAALRHWRELPRPGRCRHGAGRLIGAGEAAADFMPRPADALPTRRASRRASPRPTPTREIQAPRGLRGSSRARARPSPIDVDAGDLAEGGELFRPTALPRRRCGGRCALSHGSMPLAARRGRGADRRGGAGRPRPDARVRPGRLRRAPTESSSPT